MNVDALAAMAVNEYHADQKPWELAQLGHILRAKGCRSLIEVGTFRGGTAWFFHALGLQVTTIDIHPERRDLTTAGVVYIEGDSNSLLAGRCADVVFIDGAHSFDAVSRDWINAQTCVRSGGLVAFHDITRHNPGSGCEVHQLWWDIKTQWRTVEILDPAFTASQVPWAGIGVVSV